MQKKFDNILISNKINNYKLKTKNYWRIGGNMLSKVKIKNFLSIKDEQTIKINKDITSVIGKNESGKSTILKAINKLNGYGIENEEKNVELKSEESYIKGIFILDEKEISSINAKYLENDDLGFYSLPSEYGNLYYEITIKENEDVRYYLLYYLDQDKKYIAINNNIYLMRIIDYIKNIDKKFELNKEQKEALSKTYKLSEKDIKSCIDKELVNLSFSEEVIEELKRVSSQIKPKRWIDLLPSYKFTYFSSFDSILKDNVLFSELETNQQAQNILDISGIDIDELANAYENSDEQSLEDIGTQCIEIVSKKFKEIFQQTDTDFKIKIRFGSAKKDISFFTQDKTSGNKTISLSKRSDGFRWYLSLYLTIYDYLNNDSDVRYILLLDEPNLYLHPGAQKNLLFNVFKKEFKDTQIIYTTHSPYMIDSDNSYSIKIIEKDKQTLIYNSSQEYAEKNTKMKDVDTITPLLTALELDVSNSIVFDSQDILVTVEGIQDIYILKAMIEITKNENNFNKIKFIPGIGASKIPYLYSYLYGMGYNVYALLDNDKAGRDAINDIIQGDKEDERADKLFKYDLDKTTESDFLLEYLFSTNDRKEHLKNKSTILYKRIYDNRKTINLEEETIKNFKEFFKKLLSKLK